MVKSLVHKFRSTYVSQVSCVIFCNWSAPSLMLSSLKQMEYYFLLKCVWTNEIRQCSQSVQQSKCLIKLTCFFKCQLLWQIPSGHKVTFGSWPPWYFQLSFSAVGVEVCISPIKDTGGEPKTKEAGLGYSFKRPSLSSIRSFEHLVSQQLMGLTKTKEQNEKRIWTQICSVGYKKFVAVVGPRKDEILMLWSMCL